MYIIMIIFVQNIYDIYNRLIHGLQALLAADHQLAEGKDKVRFQRKGAVVLAVIEVNIHRVDVLRLPVNALARRGKPDYLSAQTLHKGEILRFRVADDNVVVRNEESVCHFPLCRKGFTRFPAFPKSARSGF